MTRDSNRTKEIVQAGIRKSSRHQILRALYNNRASVILASSLSRISSSRRALLECQVDAFGSVLEILTNVSEATRTFCGQDNGTLCNVHVIDPFQRRFYYSSRSSTLSKRVSAVCASRRAKKPGLWLILEQDRVPII